ncbi:MAG: CYTH domain-containing protein, partial [Antricoccus sp.]
MSSRSGSIQPEIERKYDVPAGTPLPDLADIEGVQVGSPVEHLLEATYFDTVDLALARARITLRRRTGGDDAGWHLK